MLDDEFVSTYPLHAQYGTYGGAQPVVKESPARGLFHKHVSRSRLNIIAILASIIAPWGLFTLNYALLSLEVHWNDESIVGAIVGVSGVLIFLSCLGVFCLRQVSSREPSWVMFFLATSALAWVLAVALGEANFEVYMRPHVHYAHMRNYKGIDPTVMRGQQLLDAGIITFVNTSTVDLSKSMAFKNDDVYCVAPITDGSDATSYDFWAVGVNCCNERSSTGAFRFNNCLTGHKLHSAMRWVRDKDRPYFRLAVQQAEATHNITAAHPLFFTLVKDADEEVRSLKFYATQNLLLGIIGFFLFQAFLVVMSTIVFARFTA